jgi:hypothetical protein
MSAHSAYHLVFKKAGVNEFGASTGRLTLYHSGVAFIVSDVFSGGLSSPAHSAPIPPETYHINLGIKGTADVGQLVPIPGTPGVFQLHHWYGIEAIVHAGAQVEWGHYRAALNEPRKSMPGPYRGNFLHGKTRAGNYTHGCICERSERILEQLWHLKPQVIRLVVEN